METTSFSAFLASIADRGFSIIGFPREGRARSDAEAIIELCRMLLSARGEASGIALSCEILDRYRMLGEEQGLSFFQAICSEFLADPDQVKTAASAYLSQPSQKNLSDLSRAVESPVKELLIRLNQSQDAMRYLVEMRSDLLELMKTNPDIGQIDREFISQFTSWFNRGFLQLHKIDWNTPAAILEKIIKYEAVHGMAGWDDLRARIDPDDRMIYGFFHPSLGDEPLIFVEVALMDRMPESITSVLDPERRSEVSNTKTAVFYSISNCQKGLRGIPLGNFLIKQVVEDLRKRHPRLREFVTLSPIPTLSRSLQKGMLNAEEIQLPDETLEALREFSELDILQESETSDKLAKQLLPVAQWYLFMAKGKDGRPVDPVARFHLGNGARLERVNWMADPSVGGMRNSFGMMVNYRYQLDEIERNHEQFANDGTIAAASNLARAAKAYENGVRRVNSDQHNPLIEPNPKLLEDAPT